jgi:hypothetical protein
VPPWASYDDCWSVASWIASSRSNNSNRHRVRCHQENNYMPTRRSIARVEREARRADDARRARDRQRLRDQALASARRHGPTDHWRAVWLVCGLDEFDLYEIRAEALLGEST